MPVLAFLLISSLVAQSNKQPISNLGNSKTIKIMESFGSQTNKKPISRPKTNQAIQIMDSMNSTTQNKTDKVAENVTKESKEVIKKEVTSKKTTTSTTVKSAEPAKPVQPAVVKPVAPVVPVEAAKPTKPVAPKTVEPVKPEVVKSAETEKPVEVKPENPVNPPPVAEPAKQAPAKVPESKITATAPQTTEVLYVNPRTAFELSATDNASNVDYIEYKINNDDFKRYSNAINIAKAGRYTILYRSVDKTGNVESAKSITIIVDDTPPQLSVKPAIPYHLANNARYTSITNSYEIEAQDASGVKKIEYKINEDPAITEYVAGQPIKLSKEGPNTIFYRATDNAGNTNPEFQALIVYVDIKKPIAKIQESFPLIPVGDKKFARKGTSFSAKAFDNESGLKEIFVKTDESKDFIPFAEPIIFTSAGEHTIEVKATDNVGNESEVTTLVVSTDDVAPATTIKAISRD